MTEAELAEGRAPSAGADVRAWSPDDARPRSRRAARTRGPRRRRRGSRSATRAHPRAAPHRPHPAAPLRPRQVGTVERVHGAHVLPDSNAHGTASGPSGSTPCGSAGRELWGEAADPTLAVADRRLGELPRKRPERLRPAARRPGSHLAALSSGPIQPRYRALLALRCGHPAAARYGRSRSGPF